MKYELSEFGNRLCRGSGIGELMDDLGHALASGGDDICMLGGGQPAHIEAVNAIWKERVHQLAQDDAELARVLGNYDPPAGRTDFRRSIAELLHRQYGWNVAQENVAVTAGGQTAFFFLFNALAGQMTENAGGFPGANGSRAKKILLPLVPEYIGYADQSVGGEMFRAIEPKIQKIGDHEFKYHVDFDALQITDDIAAICVSRPTNPSGNVLTDSEIEHLQAVAGEHNIPLIIDNAYGAPFPGAIYTDAKPLFDDNTILTMSLSKLGLPGTRTGIVVGPEPIASAISSMTSIVGLANSNVGQAIVEPMIRSDEILRLAGEVIRPYYESRSKQALRWVEETFDDSLPYRVHSSEGAFFLWLWMEGLPITSRELYERLKSRGVLVVPGNYFFFGLQESGSGDSGGEHDQQRETWRHRDECIRITFTMSDEIVRRGLRIIGEEIARAYRESVG